MNQLPLWWCDPRNGEFDVSVAYDAGGHLYIAVETACDAADLVKVIELLQSIMTRTIEKYKIPNP